ncbi:MAG: hypothetical protein NTX67_08030 [Burkholderiales bacterium]|nr:hypothetical protein [Burkholderiales bacterium]
MPTIVNVTPSFAPPLPGTGKVIIPVGTFSDYGYAMALQADGKILVVGTSWNGSNNDFSLIRLNANGSLDTSFEGDGKAIIPLGTSSDEGRAIMLQADGKILVAGTSWNGSNNDFSLIRLNANGSLDTSFDGDGKAIIPVGNGSDSASAMMLQADGKILVAGTSFNNVGTDFSLIRLNANGSLDTSFSGDGKAIISVGEGWMDDVGSAMTLQADGKILVAGSSRGNNTDFSLIRLNANGSLDTSFDGDGIALIGAGASFGTGRAISLQADGKILVAGSSDLGGNKFSLIRLNANGSLDTSFVGSLDTSLYGAGKVNIPVGLKDSFASAIALQADGNILVAGSSNWRSTGGNLDFSLIRLNANGSLDTGFAYFGKAYVEVGSSEDYVSAITLQTNGKILVAGFSANANTTDYDFSLIRLHENGSLDTTLGSTPSSNTLGGTVIYLENAPAIALDSTVAIYDPELATLWFGQGYYNGASVNLARSTGANAQDTFGASGNLSFTGGNAILSGVIIGSYTNTGGSLTITFNSNNIAYQNLVDEALSSLTYSNSSDAPPASVQINWTFSDGNTGAQGTGGALAATGSTIVNITAVNDTPTGSVSINGTATQGQTLMASNTLADVDGLGTVSYQWKAGGTNISGATSNTYTLTQSEVGKAITVVASYTDGGNTAESVTSSVTSSVLNVNDAPTGSVTISGTATQGQTLTVSNMLADADGLGTVSYQWKAGGVNIGGATSSTLTLTQSLVGKTVTVVASYTDLGSTAESVTSSSTSSVANVNDSPTGSVTISGTATQGQILTATNTVADADGLGSISYQWKADGINISGATSSSLTLAQAQVGKAITVLASYTDLGNTVESVTSSATTTVENLNDLPTGSISIRGTVAQKYTSASVFSTVTDQDGLGQFSYTWQVDGRVVGNESTLLFYPPQADVGKYLTVKISYVDGFGKQETVTSAGTLIANTNDKPHGSVFISGGIGTPFTPAWTVYQGQVLTATNDLSDNDGMGVISYQWKADGLNIVGATNATFTLTQAQVGKAISVSANYTDLFGMAESVETFNTSNAVKNINDAPTGEVTIVGVAAQGQVLTAANTLADVDGLGAISYQWKADGLNISGATSSTLTLAQAQVGKAITVAASYTDLGGKAESATSNATSSTSNVNDLPTGSVTISGNAAQGQTLTAANTLADADGLGTISYQWKADGLNISGATSSTLTLAQAQVGKVISVAISYTDLGNTAESVTSTATSAVANVNDSPTGSVTLSGTATQGQTLTATNTLEDVDGLGPISYQWKANGVNISGATGSSLALTQAQVGKVITVVASYTDMGNTLESVTSNTTALVANTIVDDVNQAPKFLVGKGVVTTPIGLGQDQAYGVTIQRDGKIITAGFAYIDGNTDFALIRYNADGSLDTSFGVTGKVTTAIGLSDEKAYGLTLQLDGKILVTGYTASTGSFLNDFAIVRYNSDGSLDTSFGGVGKVTTKVSSRSETAYGLSIQPDGKIITAGDISGGSGSGFNLVRYNTDGSVDTSFGGTGRVTALAEASLSKQMENFWWQEGRLMTDITMTLHWYVTTQTVVLTPVLELWGRS